MHKQYHIVWICCPLSPSLTVAGHLLALHASPLSHAYKMHATIQRNNSRKPMNDLFLYFQGQHGWTLTVCSLYSDDVEILKLHRWRGVQHTQQAFSWKGIPLFLRMAAIYPHSDMTYCMLTITRCYVEHSDVQRARRWVTGFIYWATDMTRDLATIQRKHGHKMIIFGHEIDITRGQNTNLLVKLDIFGSKWRAALLETVLNVKCHSVFRSHQLPAVYSTVFENVFVANPSLKGNSIPPISLAPPPPASTLLFP